MVNMDQRSRSKDVRPSKMASRFVLFCLFPHVELFHNEKNGRKGLIRDVHLSHLYPNNSRNHLVPVSYGSALQTDVSC